MVAQILKGIQEDAVQAARQVKQANPATQILPLAFLVTQAADQTMTLVIVPILDITQRVVVLETLARQHGGVAFFLLYDGFVLGDGICDGALLEITGLRGQAPVGRAFRYHLVGLEVVFEEPLVAEDVARPYACVLTGASES